MKKICKIHGLTEHSLRNDGRYRCKKCNVDAVKKRRQTLKNKAIEYKGGECQNCGYDKYVGALEFHHINGEKDFGIAYNGYTYSWKKVKKELDKCILLCSNCHREAHANIIDVSTLPIIKFEITDINDNNKCIDCGTVIEKRALRCVSCHNICQRKVMRPYYEELLKEVKENGYSATGRKYGVSDNTIRNWIKSYK